MPTKGTINSLCFPLSSVLGARDAPKFNRKMSLAIPTVRMEIFTGAL